jgi:hypothetical protein
MNKYKLINNITGWLVFAVALVTYTLTIEPTASFWDCGEFISGCFKLQVVHPPGAPLFLLIGRMFTMFAADVSKVAYTINFMSGLSTAFVVLFLFWSTTHMAKKIFAPGKSEVGFAQMIAIMGAGIVCGLAATFSDTLWFSAVEGEVYALSTFFIAIVFWAMLKWEDHEDATTRDKWLILIAYLLGLSVGVHLMSLLAVPAMALIYYFKKYTFSWKGVFVALFAGFIALSFVYVGVVSIMINMISKFELLAVNDLGLPFDVGAAVFAVLLAAGLAYALFYAHKKGNQMLHTAALSFLFILIGFSTYFIVIIRANANPPINMNDPSDILKLQSYLNREQYGDRPLLYGPHFNAYPTDIKKVGKKYAKVGDKYEVIGDKIDYEFNPKDMMPFPRLGSWQDDRHVAAYRAMLGLGEKENPTMADNLSFFFGYQIKYMWFRYFMWNFSGRQDDIQGRFDNNNGNWITGFEFFDKGIMGSKEEMTDYAKQNGGWNKFYLIPFLLGIFGLIYHFQKDRNDALVILTLFAFTGVLEIVFFNSPPFEPRERDYTLVGSFATFCIWIGFGVLAIYDFLSKKAPQVVAAGVALVLSLTAPALMAKDGWDDHDRSKRFTAVDFAINYLESCEKNAILFTQGDNDTYPLWYAQEVEGIRTDVRVVNLSLLGVDWYIRQLKFAMNDAPSVKISFTDDQFLGSKRDVTRYYDTKKLNQNGYYDLKEIIKFIATDKKSAQVQLTDGQYINYLPVKNFKLGVDASKFANAVPASLKDSLKSEIAFTLGSKNNLLKNDLLLLDIVANNINDRPIYFAVSVSPDSYLGMEKYFQLEGLSYRIVPIETNKGDGQYGYVDTERMYHNVMTKFKWGGIERKKTISYTVQSGETLFDVCEKFDVMPSEVRAANNLTGELTAGTTLKIEQPVPMYLDENIQRMTMNLRSNFTRLADALTSEQKLDSAKMVLNTCQKVFPEQSVPYNIFMIKFPEVYYAADDKESAQFLMRSILKVYEQELRYNVTDVARERDPGSKRASQQALAVMYELERIARFYKDDDAAKMVKDKISSLQNLLSQSGAMQQLQQ